MKTAELNQLAFNYILNAIDGENYGKTFASDEDKVRFVMETFKDEYGWSVSRIGLIPSFREWLMGLPSSINIDFENYRIIEIAKEWGSLPQDATDRQEDKIINNWFNFIANKFFQLAKRYKISY